jgi:hypothetical protein
MAYSKAKLKSSGDKASPCFRPFWTGKLSDKCSAEIPSLPGDLYLFKFSIAISTSKELGSGASGSAVCISRIMGILLQMIY